MTASVSSNYFLLICTDAERDNGELIPALEVARARMIKGLWPLYARTKNRRQLAPGDVCLVYVGGTSRSRQSVIGSAEVGGVSPFTTAHGPIDDTTLILDPPAYVLQLRSVRTFDEPVSLSSKLGRLTFLPRNLQKWGSALQGGCVRISKHDYTLLAPLAKSIA